MSGLSFAKVHNLKMAIRNDDPGISSILKKPRIFRKWHREPEFMSILERYLESEEIFFDLGCNIQIELEKTLIQRFIITKSIYPKQMGNHHMKSN